MLASGGLDRTITLWDVSEAGLRPDGLLVDFHLDEGNGIDANAELRRRFGADLTAILITANRSPRVRDDARARHPGAQ